MLGVMSPFVEGEAAARVRRDCVPEVALGQELGHEGDCVLQHARPEELHDVAVVQGLEDGHLVQKGLPAAGVAGLQDLDCDRRRTVQLAQEDLQERRGTSLMSMLCLG